VDTRSVFPTDSTDSSQRADTTLHITARPEVTYSGVSESGGDRKPRQDDIILDVKDLRMYFPVTRGLLRRKIADVKAVDNVSFKIRRGET
jgi:ABC-type microcin C transport system duplicated ATPase subunit YejF